MKVLIIGNGLAGTLAAKTLRELGDDVEIDVFGEEPFPYYPRPNLIEFLAGRLPYERLFAFPDGWAERQRINLHLGEKVEAVSPAARSIETAAGKSFSYDRLLLAPGARAARPPVPGADRKGVFVLRTLDDATALLDALSSRPRVVVLGGGLLGLEIARALGDRGADVGVVEVFERLLPRQLDQAAADILKGQIERAGIAVRLKATTREILGDGAVSGLLFEDGERIEAGTVVVAAGVRPETDLAKDAGLTVNRGVVVDDRLCAGPAEIFAAGDAAEHRGRAYGIIPAAFEQARAAAHNILGLDMPYVGTTASNTLKVAGLYVTSVGEVFPEGPGFETVVKSVPEAGLYKKLVLREGRLVGAIWMGTRKGATEIGRLVSLGKDLGGRARDLLEESFDFKELE